MTKPQLHHPIFRRDRTRTFGWSRLNLGIAASVLAAVLAGCADSDADRRFANDPLPTEDIAAVPTVAPTSVQVEPVDDLATPIPPEQLIAATGRSGLRFVVRNGEVLAIPLDGQPAATIAKLVSDPVAVAAAPDGSALALLMEAEGATELLVIGADGTERLKAPVASRESSATPAASVKGGRNAIAWSDEATHLLVSSAGGGIFEFNLDGSSRVLLDSSQAPSPRAISWSPGGTAIAYVDAGQSGDATALYVASIDTLPIDPVVVIRPSISRARQIAEIDWVGGDAGILYSQRAADDDLSIGGDLFAVQPFGGSPRLVAAAGGASEVGVIGEFAASADGQVVAYTVVGVVNGQPGFAGLWIRQIDGPSGVQVPAGNWEQVGGLVWSTAGLTWLGSSGDGVAVELLQASGSARVVYGAGLDATPVASPVASPAGSPVPSE